MDAITKIELRGLFTVPLKMVGATPQDRFTLKGVDGLGPVEVDVSIAQSLNAGGVYQGRRPLTREIVVDVGLNPNYTAGERPKDLRNELYGLLTPGEDDYVMVTLFGTTKNYTTKAWVKRIEPKIFSKDADAQVVLTCLNPFLEGTLVSIPNFPAKTNFEVANQGSAPTGFTFQVTLTGATSFWGFTNAWGNRQMQVNYNFQVNDVLKFTTTPGVRSVIVTRGGVPTDISGRLTTASSWMMMHGGVNIFAPYLQAFNWGFFNYTPMYWGV